MSHRRTRTILLIALPFLGAFCGTSAPSLREPLDQPLDDIDVAVADGGAGDVEVDARDGGPESADTGASADAGDQAEGEGSGSGEQDGQLGIDLRAP